MKTCGVIACLCLMIIHNSYGQLPPRLQIPGAVLVGGVPQRAQQFRQARLLDGPTPPRLRRPPLANAVPLPIKEVRPVVEEPEDRIPSQLSISSFDDEVNKLVRDAVSEEEEQDLRPQKTIPVLRENIRENLPRPVARPAPVLRAEHIPRPPPPALRPEPIARPLPVLRAEPAPIARGPVFRGDLPQRQIKQQEFREELPVVRAPVRQQVRQPQPQQQLRPSLRPAPRPYDDDEENNRRRKPVVQILRKYRTDNADGSITWGFENEDGTFKEETLGVDCITRGKYGYIDPDGVKREYNYETGNKCDEQPLDEEELLPERKQIVPQGRKPVPPQFRPQPGLQYAN